MNLSYQNTKLEKLLCSATELKKKYGVQVSDKIISCLQDLDAAECLTDVPRRLRPHPREPKVDEVLQVDILKHKHSTRLFFRPIGEYEIEDYDSIIDIEIIEVIKTHS